MAAADVLRAFVGLTSPYEQMLVPKGALNDQKLFLLESDVGDWGQRVHRARQISVSVGNADDRNVAIRDGLRGSERVILESSAELADGQIVLLDGFE